jgi:hypothetical protein
MWVEYRQFGQRVSPVAFRIKMLMNISTKAEEFKK